MSDTCSEHQASWNALRKQAERIFMTGVRAADPGAAVRQHLTYERDRLRIVCDQTARPPVIRAHKWTRVHVIAFGKAAVPMATAVREIVPRHLLAAPLTAVTSYENASPVAGLQVLGAAHPLPDENGLQAARTIARIAGDARRGELVLALISGGASALLPLPPDGISLADKIAATQLLLACGADIGEINTVRKHLSLLKGGGLARLAAPADFHALILSDVIGDDLSTIASGPTVPDDTTFAEALQVFEERNLTPQLPASVREHLERGCAGAVAETPGSEDAIFANTASTLIGSNRISLDAAIGAAESQAFAVQVHSRALHGEAREVARQVCRAAMQLPAGKRAILAGGETTVTLHGDGRGGRNQELALAFALYAQQQGLPANWVLLSGGTDGIDGPTDAAGGLVDPGTLQRVRQGGGEPDVLLANNDAYHALQLSNDLLITGATGTNVADLLVMLKDDTG